MITLPMAQYQAVFDMIAKSIPEFEIVSTSRSQMVIAGRTRVLLTDTPFKFATLGLMRQLRSHVKTRLDKIKLIDQPTRYYSFCGNLREKLETCGGSGFEYDIQSAYLNALKSIGAVDDLMYEKLAATKKRERLAVIGALATRKVRTLYRNGVPVQTFPPERDAELFAVWRSVVTFTDQLMWSLYNESRTSLFYWVDAIFTTSERVFPVKMEKNAVSMSISQNQKIINLADGRFFPILKPAENHNLMWS